MHPQGAQAHHLLDGLLHLLQQQAFGHLQGQPAGIHPRALDQLLQLAHKPGLLELDRTDIHRDAVAALLHPRVVQQPAGLLQHPVAHRHHQPGVLGHRNELRGVDHAVDRVLPAHQRLHADHPPHHVDLGLHEQLQLALLQRHVQAFLQFNAPLGGGGQGLGIGMHLPPALVAGL